mmetsp:Transcript_36901/g.99311  ORF Transcript_36901/g.99311 Transcript_36901/m.99311 type:complete len:329 (+) Transcript_36901:143-1129(+)|eukprot:CAMPEP_0119482448 /NCGR_PEP_ID=MMETSP1344-20130328/10295_1 /TAXON_ID=236787 /ORGANISM="Florenciella parvula, Strain CCMP2471" /LENGTH=328 /DNA_ID=CAMNT_0007516841 /DNA_START=128 /DNA_END=1114 /DNA_ORIENTATION=+
MGMQQSYERAYNESNTKVCIVLRQNQGCTHPEWSHRPGEPVPLQLAGHISQEQWTKFLTEIDTEMPLPSPWIWLCAVGIAIGFFGTIIHPAFIAFWAISIPVLVIYLCHITREQQNFLNSLVVTYGETFRAVGVQLSNEMVVEGSGKNKREIKWIQLLVTTPQGAVIPNTMVNVTVPAGCGPGAHIIVATPTGQQVSVVVPANATVGSTFQISVPAPVAPAQAHVVMATPVAPILPAAPVATAAAPQMATIHQGGFNYSNPGFTTPKQMHVILGVPVDTTGDGVADSTGYDTTGDGNIDAVDNTGDGKINFTTGNTKAQVGSDMRPSI